MTVLESGAHRSGAGGTVDVVAGDSTDAVVGGSSASLHGESLGASAGIAGDFALSGGSSDVRGGVSLDGGVSDAGVGGRVTVLSGTGSLRSGAVSVGSGISASGNGPRGQLTVGSGCSADVLSGSVAVALSSSDASSSGDVSAKSGAAEMVSLVALRQWAAVISEWLLLLVLVYNSLASSCIANIGAEAHAWNIDCFDAREIPITPSICL
ncbi:hypothetical protein PHYBOEH_005774 [Phytophthora boehmeriae]|uniref:Uncharacterized protein n=1 Tax=Phytophthora boehmeriae TaxID=109152 RepID=A0A8T1X935_9STRA|nr:hypothetical protein PHYBOEH_005774 [Phytophthora boehmeriae]